MKISELKKAATINQVLAFFDSHKQDYINQHDYYRDGDFEHVRSHIKRGYLFANLYPQSRGKALNHAKQRVVSALGGTHKQYTTFA